MLILSDLEYLKIQKLLSSLGLILVGFNAIVTHNPQVLSFVTALFLVRKNDQ